MKTVVFFFCLFCASAGFAQIGGSIGGQVSPIAISDHPLHAQQHDMGRPQDILEHSDFAYEKGERPLWEFGPLAASVPLGDIARTLRKQHALVKKADIIWEN